MVLLLAAGEQGRAPGLCADVPGGCARRAERRRGGALRPACSDPPVAGLSAVGWMVFFRPPQRLQIRHMVAALLPSKGRLRTPSMRLRLFGCRDGDSCF